MFGSGRRELEEEVRRLREDIYILRLEVREMGDRILILESLLRKALQGDER